MYIDSSIKTSGLLQTQNLQLIHTQIKRINSNTRLKRIIKHKRREQEKKRRKKSSKNKSKTANEMATTTYI